MGKLDLSLNKDKSKLVNIWEDSDGFDFLGFHHRKLPIRRKGGNTLYVMSHIPSKKAMKQMRFKIKEFTEPRYKLYMELRELVKELNRRLQGFKNYYLISPIAKRWLNRIDWYVLERLTLYNNKKRNRKSRHGRLKDVVKEVYPLLVKLAS